MEPLLINGDYVPDGLGGVVRCSGSDALLQRVLFRLSAHRGQFPLLPSLGSRLYLLSKEPQGQRLSAARQFAAEALADENISLTDLSLAPDGNGHFLITVSLNSPAGPLSATVTV